MNTTATKPSPVVAIAQAAGQGTTTRPKNGCKDCVKEGLAILPVVPTAAPIELRGKTPELQALDSRYAAEDLKQHWYVLRTLPEGYLYVFKEKDRTWDAYAVDADGMLRMVPTGQQPASPKDVTPMKEACKRQGDNLPAQVIAVDPAAYPVVWLAYSRYRWTQNVLDDYRDDKDKRRTSRMTRIDVAAAAANNLGQGKAVPNGAAMSAATLPSYVADFASTSTQDSLNKHLLSHLRNRAGQAEALAMRMAHISRSTVGRTGCLIALNDPVGNAIELGASRDGYAYKVAEASGLFDADGKRARERVVAEMVEAVLKNAKEKPGPWYDRNYGPDRYLKHLRPGAVQAAMEDNKAFKANLALVDACSADYVAVKESALWKAVQCWDFDSLDDRSALDHSAMVADSTRGSGVTKLEKERVWYPVLADMRASDPNNWFYRAMAALHPDLQAYFDAEKKWDKEFDIPKGMAALVRDIGGESAKQIAQIHAAIRLKRAANQSTADLIEGATSLLLHLREKDQVAYQKLIRRVTVALITRADLIAEPVIVKGRYNQLVQQIQSVAAGEARTVGAAPVSVRPGAANRSYMAEKGNLGGKGLALSQGVDGAVLLDLPADKNEVRSVGAWVVGRLREGGKLRPEDLGRLKLRNVDLTMPNTTPAENVWLKNKVDRIANGTNIGLSGFAAMLQIVSLSNAAKDLVTKTGTMNRIEAGIGVTTAVMSGLAALLEVQSAVIALRGGEAAMKTALRTRLIAKLAGGANIVEGGWLVLKGASKATVARDVDSGLWTVASGVFLIAGGATTIVGGSLVAGAVMAGTSTLTVPIIGWAIATVIFLGISIYCLVNAFSTDDNKLVPLEYWLDNGSFGLGKFRDKEENPFYDHKAKLPAKPFATLADEARAFQRIVFAAVGNIAGLRDRNNNGMISAYQVDLPRWVATSVLDIELHGTSDGAKLEKIAHFKFSGGRGKADQIWYANRVFGMKQDPKIEVDAEVGSARIKGNVATLQPGGISETVEGVFEWIGLSDEKSGRIYVRDIRMTVRYTPDGEGMPDIVQSFEDWSIRSAA